MSRNTKLLMPAALVLCAASNAALADQLAFTDFNDSTIGAEAHIKTGLNWALNGLENPGDMAALNAASNPQALADGNDEMRDIFAPFVNTGNGNTFWTTEIPITPASGADVTITDISFVYYAFSGSQVLNVNRESDFIVTLLDPSLGEIESVIVFGTGGTTSDPMTPTFTATFTTPIALDQPGSYTLRIKGGDLFIEDLVENGPLAGKNETGNHTGIDDLSINGTLGGTLPGDTDGDGDIDDADLGTSFANYTGPGGSGKTAADGDTDGDGDVDDGDLGTSFAGYTGPLGPAVPEPTSMLLLGLGGWAITRRRRAR